MLPTPSEPQSTGASVALGGAAFAASAMLTGLALRNRSPLPLAAGLAAAAAGLSMIKKLKGEGVETEGENEAPAKAPVTATFSCAAPPIPYPRACGCPSKFQVLDESDLEDDDIVDEQAQDWVDADAVAYMSHTPGGIIPPPPSAVLRSHATSFPLLDDEGNVMVGHQMLPVQLPAVLAESAEEFGFPLGPLIWEPETGESTQICVEPEGDILWFGTSKAALPPPSQLAQEIAVPMSGVLSLPALTLLAQQPSEAIHWPLNPSTSLLLTESPAPESVASILESLRAEAARRGETAPLVPPTEVMASSGGQHVPGAMAAKEPLSFADWMLASQQPPPGAPHSLSPLASTTSQPHLRTPLPAPRRVGEPPKCTPDESSHEAHTPSRDRITAVPTPGPALVYHRSVAPMAPVDHEEEPGQDRPLPLVLATVILTVALLAVAIWGNGYRTRKESSPPPWTKEAVPAKEQSTASAVPNP